MAAGLRCVPYVPEAQGTLHAQGWYGGPGTYVSACPRDRPGTSGHEHAKGHGTQGQWLRASQGQWLRYVVSANHGPLPALTTYVSACPRDRRGLPGAEEAANQRDRGASAASRAPLLRRIVVVEGRQRRERRWTAWRLAQRDATRASPGARVSALRTQEVAANPRDRRPRAERGGLGRQEQREEASNAESEAASHRATASGVVPRARLGLRCPWRGFTNDGTVAGSQKNAVYGKRIPRKIDPL